MFANVYEDNAGMLHIVYVDAGDALVMTYEGKYSGWDPEETAAFDFIGIVEHNYNPINDGWDGLTGAEALKAIEWLESTAEVIASTDYVSSGSPDGVDDRNLGVAGKKFVAAIAAAYES